MASTVMCVTIPHTWELKCYIFLFMLTSFINHAISLKIVMQYLTVLFQNLLFLDRITHIITVMVDCIDFSPYNIKYQPKTKCKYFICSFSISKGVWTVSGQILIAFPASFYLLLMVYNHAILLVHMLALFPSLHVSLSPTPAMYNSFLWCRNKFCPM